MKTATALAFIAVGAIFAFAVAAHPWFLNLQVVGAVLIVTGVAGVIPRRSSHGWLRRTLVIKSGADQRPGPSRRPRVTGQAAPHREGMPADRETIEEYAGR